ncbi:MAG: hypothetical protein Q8R00_03290 [Candidatus Nanoarchaeia archaeon]|nr:hypothetical protein [Candidatus Nanoarchaeia archaeon]
MIKLLKDTFLIAGALALIMLLLFLSQILTTVISEKPSQIISGKVVAEVPSSFAVGSLQFVFFLLIIFMIYLIYKTLKLPGGYSKIPRPSGIEVVPKPNLQIPVPFKPVFKEVRKPIVNATNYVARIEKDIESEIHSEFDNIRKLLFHGEHEIAKKRYKRIKR